MQSEVERIPFFPFTMLRSLKISSLTLAALIAASKESQPRAPGVIHAPLSAHSGDEVAAIWSKWRKRQTSEVDVANQQTGTSYTIEIDLGTPAQNITVLVDTGSPNLWVNADCDTSGQVSWCQEFAQFDFTASSTIEDTGVQEQLSYGKGNVVVQYVTDVVTIGCKSNASSAKAL